MLPGSSEYVDAVSPFHLAGKKSLPSKLPTQNACLGYRIDDFAYLTDKNHYSAEKETEKLDVLVLNALRIDPIRRI